jgi:hypothetical protein
MRRKGDILKRRIARPIKIRLIKGKIPIPRWLSDRIRHPKRERSIKIKTKKGTLTHLPTRGCEVIEARRAVNGNIYKRFMEDQSGFGGRKTGMARSLKRIRRDFHFTNILIKKGFPVAKPLKMVELESGNKNYIEWVEKNAGTNVENIFRTAKNDKEVLKLLDKVGKFGKKTGKKLYKIVNDINAVRERTGQEGISIRDAKPGNLFIKKGKIQFSDIWVHSSAYSNAPPIEKRDFYKDILKNKNVSNKLKYKLLKEEQQIARSRGHLNYFREKHGKQYSELIRKLREQK